MLLRHRKTLFGHTHALHSPCAGMWAVGTWHGRPARNGRSRRNLAVRLRREATQRNSRASHVHGGSNSAEGKGSVSFRQQSLVATLWLIFQMKHLSSCRSCAGELFTLCAGHSYCCLLPVLALLMSRHSVTVTVTAAVTVNGATTGGQVSECSV